MSKPKDGGPKKKVKPCEHTLGYMYSDYGLADLMSKEKLGGYGATKPDMEFNFCPDCGFKFVEEESK